MRRQRIGGFCRATVILETASLFGVEALLMVG
jgi:hypothetical protein